MTIVFAKSYLKITKYDNSFCKVLLKNNRIRHFWSQILIFLFCTKFSIGANNSRVLISNKTIVFSKLQPKDIKMWEFLSQICFFFVRNEFMHFDKVEGADLTYDNFFQI